MREIKTIRMFTDKGGRYLSTKYLSGSNKATLFLVGFHCTGLKLKTFFQTLNKKKATQKIIN